MRFSPIQDDEKYKKAGMFKFIDPGIYPFVVKKVIAGVSKQKNPKFDLMLIVTLDDGSTVVHWDCLTPAWPYKLKHFCEVTGNSEKYDAGELSEEDCLGKEGLVEITIEPAKEKSDGTFWPEKNSVKDYKLKMPKQKIVSEKKQDHSASFPDDDIPF